MESIDKEMKSKIQKLEKCLAEIETLKSEIRNMKIQKINFVFDEVTQFMMTNPDTPLDDLPEVVKKFLQSGTPERKTREKKLGKISVDDTQNDSKILSSGTKTDSISEKF